MSRLLCLPLLLVLALPLFAQEEPELSLPRDPALLMRMRDHIARELQQIQRMRSIVAPNDTQLLESLDAQQAEWTKQLREITQQMVPGSRTPAELDAVQTLPGQAPPVIGLAGRSGMPPQMMPEAGFPPPIPPAPDNVNPFQAPIPRPDMMSPMPNPFAWNDQNRERESTYWGPRLPKELTEVKESVDSLKREIAELKETIKVLETQIQLLNRNILLSEKARENGN